MKIFLQRGHDRLALTLTEFVWIGRKEFKVNSNKTILERLDEALKQNEGPYVGSILNDLLTLDTVRALIEAAKTLKAITSFKDGAECHDEDCQLLTQECEEDGSNEMVIGNLSPV